MGKPRTKLQKSSEMRDFLNWLKKLNYNLFFFVQNIFRKMNIVLMEKSR